MKPFLLLLLASTSGLLAQTAALKPLPPDGFVTLEQVVSDFSTQPEAATKKYNGMRVLVYGRVGELAQSQDADGNPLIVFLQLPNNSTPDVKCVFTLAELPDWTDNAGIQISEDSSQATIFHRTRDGSVLQRNAFVTTGQMVGVRGTFDNFVAGDVVLKDCRKESPEKLMHVLKEHGIATE